MGSYPARDAASDQGRETIDGRLVGHSERPNDVGQSAINGPSGVSRRSTSVRSAFLGRVRLAMANGSEIPTTAGLPVNLASEITISGGPLTWAIAQPNTQQIVKKIQRRLEAKS